MSGGEFVFWIALLALGMGVNTHLRMRRHGMVHPHHARHVDMMMSMAIPFTAEVAVETMSGNEILAILVATAGSLILLSGVRQVFSVTEIGAWIVSSLMSAGMGAMMVGMSDVAVVTTVLIGIAVACGVVGLLPAAAQHSRFRSSGKSRS